jgi:hypothetical protein
MRSRTALLVAVSTIGCRQLLGIGTPIDNDAATPTDAQIDAPSDARPDAATGPKFFVQASSGTALGGGELTVQLSQPLAANDVLVVAVGAEGSGMISFAVADTAGTPFAAATAQTTFQVLNADVFYGEVPAGSATDNIDVTFTGAGSALDVRVVDYRNLATATVPVALGTHVNREGMTETCAASVSVGSGGGLVVAADYAEAATVAAGPGFTERVASQTHRAIIEDDYVDAPNIVVAECTLGSAAPWIEQALVFTVP